MSIITVDTTGGTGVAANLSGSATQITYVCRWSLKSFLRTRHNSGLAAAIFMFRCRSISAGVGDMSIETAEPKNPGIAVVISILSLI